MREQFLLACGMLFLVSCTKRDRSFEADSVSALKVQFSAAEMQRLPLLSDNHRRAPETVLIFAKNFAQTMQPDSKAGFASFAISDSVSLDNDILTKGEDLNIAPLYVVSRGAGQGFVLVSGDNRITPVWGMIESGDFAEGVNPGFDIMLEELKEEMLIEVLAVESLRDSVFDNLCAKLGANGTKAKDPDPDIPVPISPNIPEYDRTETVERYPYFETEYQYGPLLTTKWGQRWPYNTEIVKTHPENSTGCAAVSMAQIMAYHKYPTYFAPTGHTYLWNQFGTIHTDYSKWTSDAIASVGYLMADIGLPQYLNMTYNSDGSSSAERNKIASAFNAFGYACGSLTDYSVSKIKEEVKNNRPVHICGGKSKGHAWVADGALAQSQWVTMCTLFYLNDQLVYTIESKEPSKKSDGSYIHHNFGWNGLDNGWLVRLDPVYIYQAGVNANTFNTNVQINTGIQPR